MKKIITIIVLIATLISFDSKAQESYGNTLNLGAGFGYYGYVGRSLPVLHANYELAVAKNFTLAPFITLYSYSNQYYWGNGNKNYPYRYYSYRETVIPVGLKATYYLDDLLRANSKWDFYLGASLGFAFRSVSWDGDYYGDRYAYHNNNRPFVNLHAGAEYHVSSKLGLLLDLSSGVSTVGIAIHQGGSAKK